MNMLQAERAAQDVKHQLIGHQGVEHPPGCGQNGGVNQESGHDQGARKRRLCPNMGARRRRCIKTRLQTVQNETHTRNPGFPGDPFTPHASGCALTLPLRGRA